MGTVVVPVNRPTGPSEAETIIPNFHFCTSGSPSLGPRWDGRFLGLAVLLCPPGRSGRQQHDESSNNRPNAHDTILESGKCLPILYFMDFVR